MSVVPCAPLPPALVVPGMMTVVPLHLPGKHCRQGLVMYNSKASLVCVTTASMAVGWVISDTTEAVLS